MGLVEGVAQATQQIVMGFSGYISDKLQKRKSIALVGYLMAALSKPLIGSATIWQSVLGARFLDRFGTGTRSAPRDAMIAASAEEKHRGKAFGLEGIGDNLGAFLGPLLAVFLLFYLNVGIRQIFYLAIIPGLIAVGMILLVKEKSVIISAKAKLDLSLVKFDRKYWIYLLVTAVFGLGASSTSFLILQTRSIGVSLETTIIVYAFFNLVAALVSYPAGNLSDKFGRKNILLAGFLIFLVSYLGFALSRNILIVGFLFILYGSFQGIFRAVGKTLASDLVPPELRASGIGWYSTVIGLTSLVASVVSGLLWDHVGHSAVFLWGVMFATLGSVLLVAFRKNLA